MMERDNERTCVDQVRVTIESLAHGGDSVARHPDGRTMFVRGGCPGDVALVTVTETHDRWMRGSIAEIAEPSPDRVTPPCPYFGECGGCQWQHVSYARQTDEKRQALVDALTRIGHLTDPVVGPVTPSASPYGYRNRVEVSAATGGRRPAFGFARAGTHDVLPIDSCLLLPRKAQRLPKALSGALTFLTSRGATDVLRATLRVASSGAVAVDLWTRPGPFPRAAVARVVAESTGASTVTRVLVRGELDRRDIAGVEILSGSGAWTESLDGDRYTVSPTSFFQVNTTAASDLRRHALDALAPDGSMRIGDLYAGVGTFTLPLARAAGEVVAVESSRFALQDLRRNLDAADLDADIVPGDAAHALADLGHLDAAIVDPPRSGLSDNAMRALLGARIPRIVYVSCDPATLSRDVARLVAEGYVPGAFVPVDLFPQTHHIETVAVLDLG